MSDGDTGPPGTAGDDSLGRSPKSVRSTAPDRGPRTSVLPYVVLVVVTFLITWFVFATITGYPVGLGPSPTSKSSSGTPATGVLLSINNPFDTAMNASTDQFAPANFTVPADTLLEFTLLNFDTGQNPVSPLEAEVNGTVSNCIYLNSTPTSLGPCEHSLPAGFVVHTFSFESGAYAGFNVPIPSAVNSGEGGIGASVTFFAYFNQTGTFTWNCEAPCDPYSMATNGFMTGTMTVIPP
ncbi:MAG: hypothetical protein WB789_09735 [Thermoplasmata archaeon]